MRLDGPRPATAMISLQLAASLRDKLNAIARERSVPRSRVVEWILRAGVASYEAEFGPLAGAPPEASSPRLESAPISKYNLWSIHAPKPS